LPRQSPSERIRSSMSREALKAVGLGMALGLAAGLPGLSACDGPLALGFGFFRIIVRPSGVASLWCVVRCRVHERSEMHLPPRRHWLRSEEFGPGRRCPSLRSCALRLLQLATARCKPHRWKIGRYALSSCNMIRLQAVG